ncbi:MAG: HAD family hydrolase [Armatimonadota bacterium]|nr:HAD family hydrolase [Armatimonadota bacterium]MDR7423443.1 HAD family hydrolase [Armatimonadota bacterium]MDR7453627.1 HAD family hydrolase [Armatimonadota bacterium]MDR7456821.1 HAD family hydrolase [Armatimonadota bacterium]MDR7495488.1 HAD family hydrolase [Armatimonadota bacterium]
MTTAGAIRAVLFDFHETLISADRWFAMEIGGIAVEMLQHLGLWAGAPPEEDRRRIEAAFARLRAVINGAGVEYSAQEIGRRMLRAVGRDGVSVEALDAAAARLFRAYLADVTVKPGAARALDALAVAGLRLGIVSNVAYGPFIAWALEAHGLRERFHAIVASAEVGLRKPRREIFAAGLEAVGVAAAEAVYVGNDYLKDVVGAKLAGMRAIWMPDAGAADYRPDTAIHPDAVVGGLDEVPAVLAAWAGAA